MSDLKERIELANKEALKRMINSKLYWIDIRKAIDTCPGMEDHMIMHAGPPTTWERMGSAQKHACLGIIQYEGWAKTPEEAEKLAASGEIKFSPCHEHNTVGSMTGATGPSTPVIVVKNEEYGNEAYCHFYENPDPRKLSFGYYDSYVHDSLKWIEEVLAPVMKAVVAKTGPFDVKRIISRALFMGDELHSRSFAATSLFSLEISPYLQEIDFDRKDLRDVADFIRRAEQFFLHFGMAGSKATADAAHGIPYSTIVTGIARNGVDTGIRVSGLPGRWFTGPASPITGLFFGNYTLDDAQPDMGDSAITETTGLGCSAHAASPALGLTKGSVDMALQYTQRFQSITIGSNPAYSIPQLSGGGSPLGIDIRKVIATGTVPTINTGIAHKNGGQIGVGNSKVPMEAFTKAIAAFKEEYQT